MGKCRSLFITKADELFAAGTPDVAGNAKTTIGP